ncbi:hypothetical protein ABMA27_004495 [Loxostege sticticalis]|uniref:Uncharacterized protein n=1 Tax=Loxostege sticticalis TaxID=481309 RepID=A0ABR3HNW1_LOXSC
MRCTGEGTRYASLDALRNGSREQLLYMIHRTFTGRTRDELHHSIWKMCSSCHDNKGNRDHTRSGVRQRVIDGAEMRSFNFSFPHTTHSLATGEIMISTMGDKTRMGREISYLGKGALEIKFLHNPKANQGFVGCALEANVYSLINNPVKKIVFEDGLMSDIILSLDDKYVTTWKYWEVKPYDNFEAEGPKVNMQIYLSLSFLSPWDKQFYLKIIEHQSYIQHCPCQNGGIKLDPDFLVHFGNEPDGPALPHEMRYPGGVCTSEKCPAKFKIQTQRQFMCQYFCTYTAAFRLKICIVNNFKIM